MGAECACSLTGLCHRVMPSLRIRAEADPAVRGIPRGECVFAMYRRAKTRTSNSMAQCWGRIGSTGLTNGQWPIMTPLDPIPERGEGRGLGCCCRKDVLAATDWGSVEQAGLSTRGLPPIL